MRLRKFGDIARDDDPVMRERDGRGFDDDEARLDGELIEGLEADDRIDDGRVWEHVG